MFLWLAAYLSTFEPAFRVVQYLSTRYMLGTMTALIVSLAVGPAVIRYLRKHQIGQMIRNEGPKSHYKKAGTPTMGGFLVLISLFVTIFLWADLGNLYVQIALLVLGGYGFIGGLDDVLKCRHKDSSGLAARWKYLFQSVLALVVASILYASLHGTEIVIPFMKQAIFDLGPTYFLLAYFVIVGSSNAVNLTDGLDGLAILPVVIVAGGLAVFCYVEGHSQFSAYLALPHIEGIGELGVVCAAVVGAGLGFLWFNAYPAEVFMGDVGSLSLGALLGAVAVCLRQELIFFIMSGVFVMETLSVILQVVSFKSTGKRIFAMAPLHHHFELKGWPESKVIIRFWIMSFIFVLIAMASLKFR